MPYDALLMFSDKQLVTATADSTNTLDLGQPSINPRSPIGARMPVDHGAGLNLPIVIKVGAAFAGLTSLTVTLQGSDAPASGFVPVATTRAVALADLKAGYEFGFVSIPLGAKFRYYKLVYTVAGTATAGDITAGISDGFQTAGRV